MKRAIFLTIAICILFASQLSSQIPAYDAVLLKKYVINGKLLIDKNKNDGKDTVNEWVSILSFYIKESLRENPNLVTQTVIDEFESNPFLSSLLPTGSFASAAGVGGVKGLISNIGGLDVTTFADGLAKFLVKRTKEELYVSFFENLADDTKYPEFKILFPRTKQLVDNFKAWEYSNIINTLRESFDKDLKELLVNLPEFRKVRPEDYQGNAQKRLQAIKTFFSGEAGQIILSATAVGQGILAKQNLPDIIHNVTGAEYLGGLTNDPLLKNSLRLLDILSMSVRSNVAGKSYISKAEFDTLVNDRLTLQIFIGLVYQLIKNESIFINEIQVAERLAQNIESTIVHFKAYYEEMVTTAEEAVAAFKELKNAKTKEELDFSEYSSALFESLNNFLDEMLNVASVIPGLKLSDKILNTFTIAKETLEIAHDISVRNYSGAISATLHFILKHAKEPDHIKGFTEFLIKYGSFAANVVQAKNSDEVEKAIESVVLPVGSASIKKHSAFNIALNAYVGMYGGKQRQATDSIFVTSGGVYAPVGISFSWGLGKDSIYKRNKEHRNKSRWSASLFVSIIDISPLVTYRFSNYNDSLANSIKIRLNQIFSPGVQAIIGFPKKPISFGGGFNWTPLLTKVESDKITVSNIDSRPFRWQIFLAVDIPLLNFHTTSRKRNL